MKPTLEIFSQGEEIITGQTVNTNAAWLSEQGAQIGFTVKRHTTVGDNMDDLVALLLEISQRADCCICTGGLGPTSDDLTAQAVASAFNIPLELDETALKQIQQFFINRNKTMPDSNRKQAMLPQGSVRLDNEWGTAPGFSMQLGHCWFAFLPGVPSEMRPMFLHNILPALGSRFSLQPGNLITIKTIGIGESAIQECLNTIEIPELVQLGFRAGLGEVQTKLFFPFAYNETRKKALVHKVAKSLGDYVFAINESKETQGDLVAVIDKLMTQGKYTLAVMESLSCGLLSSLCIGSSWLLGASYNKTNNQSGQDFIAKSDEEITNTLKTMAVELQKSSHADFVLVQLYSGDNIALHDKNKSIVLYTALLTSDEIHLANHTIAGSIQRKQNQAAMLSLDLLRRYLQFKTDSKHQYLR